MKRGDEIKIQLLKKNLCCDFKTLICCNLVFLNISYEYGYAAYIDKYRLVSNHSELQVSTVSTP